MKFNPGDTIIHVLSGEVLNVIKRENGKYELMTSEYENWFPSVEYVEGKFELLENEVRDEQRK